MAGSDCESQVFANVPEGFIKLLVSIAKVAIGPSARPEFTLYQHKLSDSVSMHQAAVQFKGGRSESRRFRFVGRAMPTERHAMQMAAREAIARLRDALPSMKARRYRYLPCHVPYTCHYAFACTRGERDEAIEMLVEYLKALEAAFDNLVDDFVAARMDLVQGCTANRRELLHTAPPLSYISSSASYAPAILATARRLPTTEEFDQVIAPTPVSAAPPAAPAPAPQPSTPRLEPISEEEVESPASLGLTLGRPREVFTISD
jgi:hypothetical protein